MADTTGSTSPGCTHDWSRAGKPLAARLVLDDWQGMTAALLTCESCGEPALAWLLGWGGERLARRVYAIASLPRDSAAVYLRNMRSDYCDLTRHRMETEALVSTCGAPGLLVQTSAGTVDRVVVPPPDLRIPRYRHWRDIDGTQHAFWLTQMDRG